MGSEDDTHYGCSGDYATWEDAARDSTGYDADAILGTVRDALLKVKRGEAVYERDSVLFDKVEYSFPLLAFLLKLAIENDNKLRLIDFGGSLGTTYFQTREFLSALKEVRWAIVEQPHFVACGNEMFADGRLSFHDSIAEAKIVTGATVALFSGVIGYIPKPEAIIQEILAGNFDWVIFDRTAFVSAPKTHIAVQTVPPSIYSASYPARLFNRGDFMSMFKGQYDMVTQFSSYCDPSEYVNGIEVRYEGLVLRKRKLPPKQTLA